MKRFYMSAIAAAMVVLFAGDVLADEFCAPKTRDEVIAELREAERTGDILVNDESGKKLNQLYPHRYPPTAAVQGTTREQVMAELREAERTGDILVNDESGKKLNQIYPHRFPPTAVAQGKTREQVVAELREAERTGDILVNDESGKKINELYPQRFAQARAMEPMQVAMCTP